MDATASPGGTTVAKMKRGAVVLPSGAAALVTPGKPGETPAKPDVAGQPSAKPDEAKSKDTVKPVHRPAAPATSPNPEEFKVRPNSSGKIRLRFNGQPWQPVLEWLASISGMSLDWQDLPGDSLNLATQRDYTVAEVRDLINRLLLDRGFTLVCHGEVMTVAEVKKIDPSLVPRVNLADLPNRQPHEFVRVSFPLTSILAESAAEDLKPMLSPNGRLTPLNEINRLEAMDAVTNLRDVDAVLKQQSEENRPRSFQEFKLRYARAAEVHNLLTSLLGADASKSPAGMNPQQAAQEQAMAMARMQQGNQPGMPGGPGGPGGTAPKPKGGAVTMAVNERNNSILVQAGPDKMAIIAQVIDAVDIPIDRSNSLLVNLNRMQVYRLAGIDPEPVVKTLMDIGNLDPTTKLEVDKKNSAIVAYASLPDHVTIRAVIDKLTGSERKFEVIHLRRLPADYVAGTIEFMMGGGKKEKTRSSPFYSFYDSPRRDSENTKEFRVDADVEHNRLLLWVNPIELGSIEALLVKLGETPAAGSGSTVRVVDGGDAKGTQELIERIRRAWPSVAPNTLLAPAAAPLPEAGKEPSAAEPASPDNPGNSSTKRPLPKPRPDTATIQTPAALFHLADIRRETAEKAPDERPSDAPRPAPPPVRILVGPDGKLILSSEDAQALDRLEELATQLAGPRKDYRVFRLKYAWAVGVAQNLEDFFKDDKRDRSRIPWWMDDYSQNDSQDERRLSKKRKLTFISDADSNTILVEGASAEQLKTIEDLIQLYDQPPPNDTQSVRKTKLIHLKYSKAKAVADTVKDVYRDLLSSNDKALAGNNQARDNRPNFIFSLNDSDKTEQKTPRFKGLLSIGVDEVSNSLMVSAPAYLFDHVAKMVEELDQAAAPDYTVEMVRISRGMSATRMKELLNQVYMQKPGEKPPEEGRNNARPPRNGRNGRNGRPGGGNQPDNGPGGGGGENRQP